MSETELGGSRFDRINKNAFWANAHLDTKFHIDADMIDDNYNHIQDCINHPTTGLLAARKHRTNNYPHCYNRNLMELLSEQQIKTSVDIFISKFNKLYPKTGRARNFLINSDSIVLNYVKPINKSLRRTIFRLFNR